MESVRREYMLKNLSLQFGKALCVFFAIAVVMLGTFAITGHFHVDTHDDRALGIYNSDS